MAWPGVPTPPGHALCVGSRDALPHHEGTSGQVCTLPAPLRQGQARPRLTFPWSPEGSTPHSSSQAPGKIASSRTGTKVSSAWRPGPWSQPGPPPVTRSPSSREHQPRASYKGGHACRLYNLISAEYLQKEMPGGGRCPPPPIPWLALRFRGRRGEQAARPVFRASP